MSNDLHTDFDEAIVERRRRAFKLPLMAAVGFIAMALAYSGRDGTAEYRFETANVLSVAQHAGRDLPDRQLVIKIDGVLRIISDRNRLEIARIGSDVCVRRARYIFGFVRYSIWPKGFCVNTLPPHG